MATLTNTLTEQSTELTSLQKEYLKEIDFIKNSSFDEYVERYHIDLSMYPNEEYAKFQFTVGQEMMKIFDYVDMNNFLISYFEDKLDDDMEVEDFAVEFENKMTEYLTEKVFPVTEENVRKVRTDLSKEYIDENLPKTFEEILESAINSAFALLN